MTVLQKWLMGLIALGALFLVVSNPRGVAVALSSGQKFISGTERTAITGR